jgi:HEAT repeat protein
MMLAALCFPSQADDRTLNAFIQALGDNDSHTRMEAAVSLGDLGDPRAVEPLIKALNDTGMYVRDEAARALGKIGDRRAVDPLIRVLKENLADYTVIESLAWFADPKSIDVLSQAIDEINKKKIYERDRIDYIKNNFAVWGIARTKDPQAIDPLINALQNNDLSERSATSGLVAIGKPAVNPLIHALNDNGFKGRDGAATTLGEIGDPQAIDPLIQILKNTSEESSLRIEVALALGAIGNDRAIDPLIQASKDSNKDIRYYASDALVMINNHVKPKLTPMPDSSEFF